MESEVAIKRFLSVFLLLALLTLTVSCKGGGEPAVQTTPVRVGVENQGPGGGQGGDPDPTDTRRDETEEAPAASGSDEFFSYTLQSDGYSIRKRTGATLPNQLVIPSSFNGLPVVAIDSNAFVGAQNVVSVEIPDSVQWIDASAFSPSVKKVTCPADLDLPLDLKDQVTSLVLTSGVVSDCVAMFELEEVELLAGVTGIGVMAFFECDGLKTVTIHNGLREIGEKAFQNCSALTSIVLPDSVVEIEAWAFAGCWALSSIEIGRNVSYIGQCAFNDCPNLRGHITVDAENPYFYATNGTLYTAQGENLTAEMFG